MNQVSSYVFVLALFSGLVLGGCSKNECAPAGVTTPTAAAPTAGTDATRAVAKKFADEIWGKKNPDAALELCAPDLVNHAATPEAQGAEGLRSIVTKVNKAFPDMKSTVESLVVEGDRATIRVVHEGTMTGALEFKTPIPASNKHVTIVQVHEMRVANGKIVEVWMTMDKSVLR